MRPFRPFIAVLSLTAVLAACSSEAPKKAEEAKPIVDITHIMGARFILWDGSAPIEEGTAIIENGVFTAIGKKGEFNPPKGSLHLELQGQTLIPLMINLHGHAGLSNGANFGPQNYKRDSVIADINRFNYYGVSNVALLGSDKDDTAFQIRDEQRQGKLGGAKIFTAGRGITAKGGWPAALGDIPVQIANEADARKAVNEQADRKVDLIKIWVDDNFGRVPKLRPELSKAVIDEAHKRNLKVVAHIFDLADARQLVKDGIDGLVHSIRDREVDDALIADMKAKNVFYVPTLVAHESRFVYADSPKWLGEQVMREVYPAQLSAYLSDPVMVNRFRRDPDTPKQREAYKVAVKNLKKMADAGVKIGFGTDSGASNTFPGYFEHRELELMAEAGLAPGDVIKAATSVSAEILGVKDAGVLAVGKRADFLQLSQNPLEDMKNSKEITTMYIGGHEVDRQALIQNIQVEIPKVTAADRAKEAVEARKEAEAAAEAKMEHFGKYVLGTSASVRGLAIPTPKGSKAAVKAGPPDQITVTMSASAADLSEFYKKALLKYRWQAAGSCFERSHPISNKTQVLCLEPAANSIALKINEK